jgi:mRNA interferase YafQ
MKKLRHVMEQLIEGKRLSRKHNDHALKGEWLGNRECHIEGDWLLIYRIDNDNYGSETITFQATGSHAELFK